MDIISSAVFGALRGLFSGLPVSADGIAEAVFHFFKPEAASAADLAALACAGAVLAFALRYIKQVAAAVKDTAVMLFRMCGSGFSYEEDSTAAQRDTVMLLVSMVPALVPLLAGDSLRATSSDGDIVVEGVSFLVCGAFLLAACRSPRGRKGDGSVSLLHSLLLGLAAMAGVFPGISAFSAVLSAALMMGYSAEYSVRRAALISAPYALINSVAVFGGLGDPAALPGLEICLACAGAALVTAFAAVWLSGFAAKKEKMSLFAYIMIAAGVVLTVIGAVETAAGVPIAELIAG